MNDPNTEFLAVRVGQIWEDCDPRVTPRRRVRILSVDDLFCACVGTVSTRKTRISIAAFRHPKGSSAKSDYRLVEEAPL